MFIVAHSLFKPSHVWMQRRIQGLRAEITTVLTDRYTAAEASGKPEYKDIKFEPVWQMQPPFIERVKSKVKKGSGSAWHGEASRRVEKLLNKRPQVPLLVNFFHHAVEIENAIQQSRNPLVIFVHGHDIQWNLHPPEYKDACLQLAKRGVIAPSSQRLARASQTGVRSCT